MKNQFTEQIHQLKLKHKESSTSNPRNHLNESYQQYEFLNNQHSFHRLVETLSHLEPNVYFYLSLGSHPSRLL
jgi:hypothetical protein